MDERQSRPPSPSTLEAVTVTALSGDKQNFHRKGIFQRILGHSRGLETSSLCFRDSPVEMVPRGLWTESARLTLLLLDVCVTTRTCASPDGM